MNRNKAAILIAASLVFSLSACQGMKSKKADNSVSVADQPYQTADSAAQAQSMVDQEEIRVDDRVFFGYDSYKISEEGKKTATLQSEWLKSEPSIKVLVEGHCDERGTREYNIALGERRAKALRDFLVKSGIHSSRIKTVSYGKEKPAYIGSSEDVWAKNRRAVIVVDGQ